MLFGIAGKARSGKDTLRLIFIDELAKFNVKFVSRSLGDAVKELYCDIKSLTLEEMNANKAEHREGLQTLGEGMRETFPDYWIEELQKRRDEFENTILADIRYQNEYRWVAERGIIVKVWSDEPNRDAREAVANKNHISEIDLDSFGEDMFDYVFENNGSIEELEQEARRFIQDNIALFRKAYL